MEAQRYPDDYNGIVSGAPAINWPKLMMQSIWSTAVMNAAGGCGSCMQAAGGDGRGQWKLATRSTA